MSVENDETTVIGGNEDLNESPSPSTLSPADWSATGGRRRTRKSRGKKRGGNGIKKSVVSRYEAAAGETKGGRGSRKKGKKGKSRKSKTNRKK
jgi:hypothetical protein